MLAFLLMSRHIRDQQAAPARDPNAGDRRQTTRPCSPLAGMFAISIPVAFVSQWAFLFWVFAPFAAKTARRLRTRARQRCSRPVWTCRAVDGTMAGDSSPAKEQSVPAASDYLDYSGRDDVLSGGARKIPIDTPAGPFRVWVKRVGNNPDLKVLLLHGGPGATHEYFEACDSFLPEAGIEYYYYDQLGSGLQRQAGGPVAVGGRRFVEEVEQVRAGARARPRQLRALRPLLGRHPGDRVRPEVPAAPARPGHLEHDVQRARLQRVRRAGPDAGDGPGCAAEIKALEAAGRPRIRGTWSCCSSSTTSITCCGCRPRSGPIRPSAGSTTSTRRSTSPCRARASSASAATRACTAGTGPRSSAPSPCPRWSSAPATTPWTPRTWR